MHFSTDQWAVGWTALVALLVTTSLLSWRGWRERREYGPSFAISESSLALRIWRTASDQLFPFTAVLLVPVLAWPIVSVFPFGLQQPTYRLTGGAGSSGPDNVAAAIARQSRAIDRLAEAQRASAAGRAGAVSSCPSCCCGDGTRGEASEPTEPYNPFDHLLGYLLLGLGLFGFFVSREQQLWTVPPSSPASPTEGG